MEPAPTSPPPPRPLWQPCPDAPQGRISTGFRGLTTGLQVSWLERRTLRDCPPLSLNQPLFVSCPCSDLERSRSSDTQGLGAQSASPHPHSTDERMCRPLQAPVSCPHRVTKPITPWVKLWV